jgi:hypothetical protein
MSTRWIALLVVGVLAIATLDAQRVIIRNKNDPDNPTPPASGTYFTGTLRQPTCSDASIDSAITASSSGDIVRMASACASFTATITIPSSKGILFDGNGATFNSSSSIDVAANSTTSTRITNFTLACADVNSGFGIAFTANLTDQPWRMDHVTLTGSSHRCVKTGGFGAGLADHVTFSGLNAVDEFWHNEAGGCGSGSSYSLCNWDQALTPGSAAGVIYLEDSTLTRTASSGNPAWIQDYYGARLAFRFNTFTGVAIDNHGTAGNVGGRWWEVYHNTFNQGAGTWNRRITNFRAGSGIVWTNTKAAALNGHGVCEEDTGYPAVYQIGRGQSGTLVGAYFFGDAISVGGCSDAADNGSVTANVDYYSSVGASCTAGGSCTTGVGTGATLPTTCTTGVGFWKDNEGEWWAANAGMDGVLYKCTATNTWTLYYTPYTYPHPLQSSLDADK